MTANPTRPGRAEAETGGSVALDQWRGLALVLVLVAHAFHETGRVDGLGRVGVNLFFFISGLLVYRSLARRDQATPWQRTKSFWWRRLRRLYPALLMYVLAMTIGEYWLQRIPGQPDGNGFREFLGEVPSALVYLVNYNVFPVLSLGHLWSVSCEMQFYLLAPLIFMFGAASKGNRTLVYGYILLGLMGLGLVLPFSWAYWNYSKYQFQYAVWPMMLGFFCEYQRAWFKTLPARWLAIAFWTLMTVSLPGLALMLRGTEMKVLTVAMGGLLLIPCLLAYLCGWPLAPRRAGGIMRWLGVRTYSIYLWQQAFTICHFLPVKWWPVGAACSVLVGALWFHCFEAPFLSADRKPRQPPAAPLK